MINISSNIYKSSWTDLVFKNRNKAYGAYQLRAESASITFKALLIVAPAFILLFAGPALYRKFHPEVVERIVTLPETDTVVIDAVRPPMEVEPPKAEPVAEKRKTVKMPSVIQVVAQPAKDEKPPLLDDLKDAVVGQIAQAGLATGDPVMPVTVSGTGNGTAVTDAPDNTVYDGSVIEKFPEFEGGMAAWSKFIQRNLRYPAQAQEEGTQGKVFVSFVVEKDGSVSNVSVIRGIGSGCDEEAVRVIKKSPRWKPGMQHNNPVRVRYNIPLSFILSQ